MLRIALVLVCALAGRAAADEPAGPTWVSGPDRAYNCTHYLDAPVSYKHAAQVAPGEKMVLTLPRDKVMKFALAARPVGKGKVRFELESPPPGAKLAGGRFEWKVAGTARQHFDFAVVAIGDDGGRTRWPIAVTLATDQQFTAWSAGLGSVWPDCDVFVDPTGYAVEDFDGDGRDDVMYRRLISDGGETQTILMLQRGAPMKFVEAASCYGCAFAHEVAADNARLLTSSTSCCCIDTTAVMRLDGDAYVEAGSWQVSDNCNGDFRTKPSIDLVRDARKRITGVDVQQDGKVTHWRWRGAKLVAE